MSEQIELPSLGAPSKEELAGLNKYPTLREGWMPTEIVGFKQRVVPSSGNLELSYQVSPVDEAGEVLKKAKAHLRVIIPRANPAIPNHKAPNTKLSAYFLATAVDPQFPRYPRKQGDGNYLLADGTIVSATEQKEISAKLDEQVLGMATSWWTQPGELVGKRMFSRIKHEFGKTQGGELDPSRVFTVVDRTSNQEPNDEPLFTEDFISE